MADWIYYFDELPTTYFGGSRNSGFIRAMIAKSPGSFDLDLIEKPSPWLQQHYPLYGKEQKNEIMKVAPSTISKKLTDYFWENSSDYEALGRQFNRIKHNPTNAQIKELKSDIVNYIKEGIEYGLEQEELIDFLKETDTEMMRLTASKKEETKEEPKPKLKREEKGKSHEGIGEKGKSHEGIGEKGKSHEGIDYRIKITRSGHKTYVPILSKEEEREKALVNSTMKNLKVIHRRLIVKRYQSAIERNNDPEYIDFNKKRTDINRRAKILNDSVDNRVKKAIESDKKGIF